MTKTEVIIQVRVTVVGDEPLPKRVAYEMVEDALATRDGKWTSKTFVSSGDIEIIDA